MTGCKTPSSEAEAFAWAVDVVKLGVPVFTAIKPGLPDLHIPEQAWIEVKTIRPSDTEAAVKRGMLCAANSGFVPIRGPVVQGGPHPTLLTKFEQQFENALRKFERAAAEPQRIVYFRVEAFDHDTSKRKAEMEIRGWVENRARTTSVQIVVMKGYPWSVPLASTFFTPRL